MLLLLLLLLFFDSWLTKNVRIARAAGQKRLMIPCGVGRGRGVARSSSSSSACEAGEGCSGGSPPGDSGCVAARSADDDAISASSGHQAHLRRMMWTNGNA